MANDFVKHHDLDDAEEFLDQISLRGPHFRQNRLPWLFRGQAQPWSLVPKVLRGSPAATWQFHVAGLDRTKQRRHEVALVRRFFALADHLGLPLPGDSTDLRLLLLENHDDLVAVWPQQSVWPLMALAQHYGVPSSARLFPDYAGVASQVEDEMRSEAPG